MITKELRAKQHRVEQAKETLEDAIFARMVEIAKHMKLDEILFSGYGTRYLRNGKEVESKQLDELDEFYCEVVHEGGFQGVWVPEKGWV